MFKSIIQLIRLDKINPTMIDHLITKIYTNCNPHVIAGIWIDQMADTFLWGLDLIFNFDQMK